MPSELLIQVGEWLEPTEPEQALLYYEAAIAIDTECSLAAWRAGRVALKLERYEYANAKLEYALSLNPDHTPTYYLLSLIYSATADHERALEAANTGLAISLLHDGSYLQKLRSLAKLSRWRELQEACQQATPSLQSSNELTFWRAVAAINMDDFAVATEAYSATAPKIRRKYPEFACYIESKINQAR